MNLLDYKVSKVLDVRFETFDWSEDTFKIYEVEYNDYHGKETTEIWFNIIEDPHPPEVEVGYEFQR